MKLETLTLLLPCRSLEDFTLQRPEADAEQILSGWSGLWHPALLANTQTSPNWMPADDPPRSAAGHLILVPDCCLGSLPDGWLATAAEQGACLIRDWRHRDDLVTLLLEKVDEPLPELDRDLVADFLAVGYGHFLIELLTRQLRYMSNLDEGSFRSQMLKAVEEARAGNVQPARDRLRSAFGLLHDAREYFYPVEAHLLDLTLVAKTTIGESLRRELARDTAVNLLASAETIRLMAAQEPETRDALAAALAGGAAAIIGGEHAEAPLPLLPPEAIRHHLARGIAACQTILGHRPTIFGRRRFGLTPVLPQILRKLGFVACLHCTFDDGQFPTGNQSRIQWEGIDGTRLKALARVPIDVGEARAFLRLPERLGDAMDLDHVATAVMAHWPGRTGPWYEDLRRIAGYSTVVGRFASIRNYFDDTGLAGQNVKYEPDRYRSPYLQQEVAASRADPISRWVRYYRCRATVEAAEAVEFLATACGAEPAEGPPPDLVAELEDSISADGPGPDLHARAGARLDAALARLGRSLTGRPGKRVGESGNGQGESTHGGGPPQGCLIVNPWSFSRRLCLESLGLDRPADVAGPLRATDGKSAVVDVPAMGFAWIGPGAGQQPSAPAAPAKPKGRRLWGKKPKEDPPMAEENVLRNEFAEVTVDPHTGSLFSIFDYHSRTARLAQQIALRMPQGGEIDPGDDLNYSVMAADQIAVTQPGPLVGEIVARGRLVDRDVKRLAGFTQTTRLWRGSRIIEVQIELDVDRQPGPNPWSSYYAARFAWDDETATIRRSVNMADVVTDAVRLEAPHFIDIRAERSRTTLLVGGLPYHRRFGLRKLDVLLVVCGESARSFRLGIGIDLPAAMPAALGFLAPDTRIDGVCSPPATSGWLFHLDCRNAVATSWEPLGVGRTLEGFRARILETDGRKIELGLRAFRSVRSAVKLQPGDAEPANLTVEGDRIRVPLGPYEWADIEARFA